MKRNFSFHFISALILVSLSFVVGVRGANAGFLDPKAKFYTIKTDHFYIHYPDEIGSVAEDLVEIVDRVYTEQSQKFDWKPWGRTHIVLVDNTDQANGLTTVLPANYMLLFVTPPHADASLDNYKNYLEMLFTHELSHILHIDQHHRVADPFHWVLGKIVAPNGLTPGWMREGIASYQESILDGRGRSHYSFTDMVLRSAIYENNFPKIDEVSSGRIQWPGGEAQYIYGARLFKWLAGKYGEDRMFKYMEEYSSGLWLFSLNNKARRVYNKSFYKLWDEWKADLTQEYNVLRGKLEAKGLTPFEPVVSHKDDQSYPLPSPSHEGLAYVNESRDESHSIIIEGKKGDQPIRIKRKGLGQLSFSRDGGRSLLAFSSLSGVERFNAYSEVYFYDFKKKKLTRAYDQANKKGSLRATDPDFSSVDGGARWVVMVRTDLGTDNLFVYDLHKKKGYYLTSASKYTQFSNPRFSPDGTKIVVSRRDHEGNRDIVVYSKTGQLIQNITLGEAVDNHPVWSPDGRYVYLESDRSGIPNIYRFDFVEQRLTQVTNVVSGVYQPQLSSDGQVLYVQYYTSQGPDIYKVNVSALGDYWSYSLNSEPKVSFQFHQQPLADLLFKEDPSVDEPVEDDFKIDGEKFAFIMPEKLVYGGAAAPHENEPVEYETGKKVKIEDEKIEDAKPSVYEKELEQNSENSPQNTPKVLPGSKKYHAFPQVLVPRYLVPTFATLDDSYIFGMSLGRFDPLYRHSWNLYTNYRTDAAFLGVGGVYSYTRYVPAFFVGFNRYSINWGDIFGTGSDFFEKRLQGFVGSSVGTSHHKASLMYFYEDRENITAVPGISSGRMGNLDTYAGVHLSYTYARFKKFPYSISQEDGPYFKLNFYLTDSVLGAAAANEQQILTGDFRYYFEMPWSDHHVLGIRTVGGFVWGDREQLFNGTLRFGGPFGEGTMAGYSARLIPFRGLPGATFSRDRVVLGSVEYRLPIAKIERGIGTWPIFLQKAHLSLFSDIGNAWQRNDAANEADNFLVSVGAEVLGDFIVGYGLPVTGRMGYGIILTNRWRVVGLTDSLIGNDVQNGVFYLQFGTSF